VDIQGSFEDILGSFADIQGSFADVLGSFADIRGSFVDMQGSFADIRGCMQESFVNIFGSFADLCTRLFCGSTRPFCRYTGLFFGNSALLKITHVMLTVLPVLCGLGVAATSRLLKIIGLFCKRDL